MNIGVAIALFLVLSIVLLILFCAVTKYFHYKLQKALQAPEEVYSMVDEINAIKDQSAFVDSQEDYEKIQESRWNEPEMINQARKSNRKKDNLMIEMSNLKTPLNEQISASGVHGVSALRKRLDGDSLPLLQESSRSAHTLKSFPVERLNSTRRSKRSFMKGEMPETPIAQSPKTHRFTSKILCYDMQGLVILEVMVKSLKLLGQGMIKQDKKVKSTLIPPDDMRFDDQLEMFGFQLGEFGCMKYESEVELPEGMIPGEQCQVRDLKSYESKEPISMEDYLYFKSVNGISLLCPSI